jgi:tetratricopeptide (TPR) repeat protein
MTNSALSSSQHQFKIWMPYNTFLACFIGVVVVIGWWFDLEGSRLPWLIYPALAMVGLLACLWTFLAVAYPATRLMLPGITAVGLLCLSGYFIIFLTIDGLSQNPFAAGVIGLIMTSLLLCYSFLGTALVSLLVLMGMIGLAYRYTNVVLAVIPGWLGVRVMRVFVSLWLHDYEAAVQDSTIVLETAKTGWYLARLHMLESYAFRCGAYTGLGKLDKALEDVNQMVELNPDYEYIYLNRAFIYLKLGKLDLSEAALKKGFTLETSPRGQIYLHLYQGEWHYAQQDYEQALHAFKAALKIPSEANEDVHSTIYTCLSQLDFMQGNVDAAKAHMEQAYALNRYNFAAQLGLIVIRYAQGERAEVVNQWRGLIVQYPKLADADWVTQAYYQWTPKMAEVARQIIAEIAD